MFCYTVVSGINCVLQELIMWSDISSEHPIFIKTVAQLTNKNLSSELVSELNAVREQFVKIKEDAQSVISEMVMPKMGMQEMQMPPMFVSAVRRLIEQFVNADRMFLNVLMKVRQYGKEDKVWQTLLSHIIHEQEYMLRLMQVLRSQLV